MRCRVGTTAMASVALCIGLGAARASATVYDLVGQDFGNFTATGTITTDGHLGTLAAPDITSLDITIRESGLFPGTVTASDLVFSGTALSASATALIFDFDATGGQFGATTGLIGWTYCVSDAEMTCAAQHAVPTSGFAVLGVEPSPNAFNSIAADVAGSVVIATAAVPATSVPEPSTLLLVGGGGVAGAAAMRRRKRASHRLPRRLGQCEGRAGALARVSPSDPEVAMAILHDA